MTQAILKRETFTTSRLMEFFTKKELAMQMGHSEYMWPIALVKELIDNSLDACESAGIAPKIHVAYDNDSITVEDNGPGLPQSTLEKSLDYLVRVSDKNGYIAPTRGQLGNALKCVWAAPYVANQHRTAIVEVNTPTASNRITVSLDRIADQPRLALETKEPIVKIGTSIKMFWPDVARYLSHSFADFYNTSIAGLLKGYLLFNPHAMFGLNGINRDVEPKAHDWEKWQPSDPTSPHWYDPTQFRNLIASYIKIDRAKNKRTTVREFVSTFRGLSGTAKQKTVTSQLGLNNAYLDTLVVDDDIDIEVAICLLDAMKTESKPVKPDLLGIIGEEHFRNIFDVQYQILPDSFVYRYKKGEADRRPFVLEVAFAVMDQEKHERDRREMIVGLNWTPTLENPIRPLSNMLANAQAYEQDPVVIAVHLVYPSITFTERGKGAAVLPDAILSALEDCIPAVTKFWEKLRKENARQERLSRRQIVMELERNKDKEMSITEASRKVIFQAYNEASGYGQYPANARQVMYAARRLVQEYIGGRWFKDSATFTQHILPDFQNENHLLTANWDVVYDARGHLEEPHTEVRIDLGTLGVRKYVNGWSDKWQRDPSDEPEIKKTFGAKGPKHRYNYVLFVEKEGFDPLFKQVKLSDTYDIAIESTKGQTVTAARRLAEEYAKAGVTILVLHDFDKSGLEIVDSYRNDTRRYQYGTRPNIIDIGLRIEDVMAMDLMSEEVNNYRRGVDPRIKIMEVGGTQAEADFLVEGGDERSGWYGRRVELNAMTSKQMLDFLDRKFADLGVKKVIPDDDTLAMEFQHAYKEANYEKAMRKIFEDLDLDEISTPKNLRDLVEKHFADDKTLSWDEAIKEIACKQLDEEPEVIDSSCSLQPTAREKIMDNPDHLSFGEWVLTPSVN